MAWHNPFFGAVVVAFFRFRNTLPVRKNNLFQVEILFKNIVLHGRLGLACTNSSRIFNMLGNG